MFYSKSLGGFLHPDIHVIPEDAVEITDELYQSLLDGQSAGKEIGSDDLGRPALRDPDPSLESVPLSVSARQCELALLDCGRLGDVEDAIAAADMRSQIEWRTKTTVERTNPLVLQLAESLDLDLDALFLAAAKL